MTVKTLKEKTISGIIWVSIQKFGTLGISFIANIVLARILTPHDYGMVGMLAIFIGLSTTLIDGGFGSALIQKSNPNQTDYSTVFYFNLLLSICLYLILFLCAPWIEMFYRDIAGLSTILRVQGLILIINALTIVQFNQLRKSMNFKLLSRINIFSALFSVIIAITMAKLGFGVWSLVFQQIALSVANVSLLWFMCKWKPTCWISLKSLKELVGFGSYIMFSNILNSIGNNLNSLLIGKFFSASRLGYFSQAKKLEDLSSIGILSVIEQVSYPMLVEVKADYNRMSLVLKKFNNLTLAIVLPLMLCIIILAHPIIVILFSDKWIESVHILQILAIHGIFLCMQGSNYNVIAAIGKSKILFKWTVIKRIVNIIILLTTMIIWGFDGLLWGIVVTGIVIAISNMYLVQKYIYFSVWDQLKYMGPITIIALCPFIICQVVLSILDVSAEFTNIRDFIASLIFISLYLIIVWTVPIHSLQEMKLEFSNVLNKLKKG